MEQLTIPLWVDLSAQSYLSRAHENRKPKSFDK
jgi:hypothetical protein